MSRWPESRRRVAALAGLGLLLAVAVARAEEPTSQPAGWSELETQPSGNWFSLDRLDAAVELGGEYEQRRVRTSEPFPFGRSTRQTNRRQSFTEQLLLDFAGQTRDANLLSLAGSVGLGGIQERYDERFAGRTDADGNDGYLGTYDVHADWFRDKKLSVATYALQSRDRYARAFLPSLREERREYGAAVYWTDDVLPMQLTFDHRAVDRTAARRRKDDENLTQDTLRYQATWISSQQHSLKLQYEYAESDERYSGSKAIFDNVRNQVRLDDEILFGAQRQHRLDTVVRFQDETGDYARDLFEAGPRLSLRHTDTLTTNYQYQFRREEYAALQYDTHRVDLQAVHTPRDWLTGTYALFGLDERASDDSETRELGVTTDWSLVRENALGRFSANLSLTAESERTSGGGTRAVTAESGVFLDPLPITLSRPGVLPWSVTVRDPTRLRIYVPGFDYLVQRIGDRTLIFRNPLGLIPIGASVSIDYLYAAPRGGQRDSQLVNFSVEQEFKNGLTPFYRLDFRNDDRDQPSHLFRYDDYQQNRHRAGLRFRRDALSLGAEFELLQDEIDPFSAYRLYAAHGLIRQPARTVDARIDFSHYFFERNNRNEALVLELSLDGRAALSAKLDGFFTSRYRYEHDGLVGRGNIHGVDVESGLAFRLGQFTLTASIEYDLLTIADTREDGLGVWLRVRRDLPNLLGSAMRLRGACVCLIAALAGCGRPAGNIFDLAGPPPLFPPPPDAARIAWVGQIRGDRDLKAAVSTWQALGQVFTGPPAERAISAPAGVAVTADERVFVTDPPARCVHLFDLRGRTYRAIISAGGAPFAAPADVAIGAGRVFVSDAGRGTIDVFSPTGEFVATWSGLSLRRPVGLAFDAANERLYVVDSAQHACIAVSMAGAQVARFGSRGVEPGQLNFPTFVAVDPRLGVLVADSLNARVQRFDTNGQFVSTFGKKGDGAGDFSLPKGVAIDAAGHIYVADAHFENVQVFDGEGRLLLALGGEGQRPGQFWLPSKLHFDPQGRLWVADSHNRRLQVFRILPAAGEPTT